MCSRRYSSLESQSRVGGKLILRPVQNVQALRSIHHGIGRFQWFDRLTMRGPTFTATLHSKLNPKPVPVVPAVPPLRSVPIVSAVQRSRTDSQDTLAHFGNYRNVEMAAM